MLWKAVKAKKVSRFRVLKFRIFNCVCITLNIAAEWSLLASLLEKSDFPSLSNLIHYNGVKCEDK